jgi:hypothetical protein
MAAIASLGSARRLFCNLPVLLMSVLVHDLRARHGNQKESIHVCL